MRARGSVRCAGVPRPGLAAADDHGRWAGLEVDVCRAIAVAALGPDARFAFRGLVSDKDFAGVRAGEDQVFFLTFPEMLSRKLTDEVLPGPSVFIERQAILVSEASSVRRAEDLGGQTVCSLAGSAADASLDAFFGEKGTAVRRHPFSEEGEMYDAFRVQSCKAVAAEVTSLAEAREDSGVNHLHARLLPEAVGSFPIYAATSVSADTRWAAIVSWTIDTLLAADRPATAFRAGSERSMPVSGRGLGLSDDWQSHVVRAVGSYASIFRRSLGSDSPLKLDGALFDPRCEVPNAE